MIDLIRGQAEMFSEGYVRKQPAFRLSKGIITNLRDGVRTNMNYLIANYMLENDVEEAYFLSDFLTRFDKGHFDDFVIFGRISKLLGRSNEAGESFQEAVGICKGDKKWNLLKDPECPATEEVTASIEKEIENLEED